MHTKVYIQKHNKTSTQHQIKNSVLTAHCLAASSHQRLRLPTLQPHWGSKTIPYARFDKCRPVVRVDIVFWTNSSKGTPFQKWPCSYVDLTNGLSENNEADDRRPPSHTTIMNITQGIKFRVSYLLERIGCRQNKHCTSLQLVVLFHILPESTSTVDDTKWTYKSWHLE